MAVNCYATMSQLEIQDRFKVRRMDLPDRNYGCPSEAWVLTTLADRVFKLYEYLGITKWRGNFDCDNFATAFMLAAAAEWGQRPNEDPEGIAIGELSYLINGNRHKGHRINVAFVGEKKKRIYLEPQHILEPERLFVPIELSKREQRSIRRIKFP